ncbi:MAG: N-acetylmuramoyl-L-alanine amidase, partial [Oscillospiraceae bacterium]|nr:N-acetylmuramoyl-L-alanine amidase [Oscillospiraceae bacterium]
MEQLLKQNYTGYQLLRIDDTTGETDVPLQKRTDVANQWKADLYLSIHHNAGINGGKGGGIIAIVYTDPQNESVQWQQAFYDELIRQTGLKGNRAQPLTRQNLHEVRETVMPAVLLELGFMDSSVDVPIILTEKFADQCAASIVRVIA